MSTFAERLVRAARLDAQLYEEVEADEGSMGQATAAVVLSSLAAGVGRLGTDGLAGIVFVTIGALLGWYIWAFLTYFIGTRLLPEPQTEADLGQLLRTTGFSSAPGLIRAAGVIPGLGLVVSVVAGAWMLAAMIVAVRQALDYQGTARAVGVCAVGFVVQVVILAVLFAVMGVSL